MNNIKILYENENMIHILIGRLVSGAEMLKINLLNMEIESITEVDYFIQ